MRQRVRRRQVLRNALAIAALSALPAGAVGGTENERRTGFTPDRDGFGFRNWSTERQPFETPEATTEPSPAEIRERVRTEWENRAPDALGVDFTREQRTLLEILTAQLRSAIVQRAGTNGHCYGMVLAAQGYFESPASLPLDRSSPAVISHPMEPISRPDAPVYEAIVRLQAEQFLRFRSWLGRRVLLFPDRIDVAAQLNDIRAVIDVFGTAQVMVFTRRTSGHQVLAYDYEEHRNGVSVYVYDPNYRAEVYERHRATLEFEATADGFEMKPYGKYRRLLFNRYDRIENATGRSSAGPLDHVDVDSTQLREELFPIALATVDTPDVELTIADPNGRLLGRFESEFMDRSRGPIARLRSTHGADAGTYRIRLYGQRSTSYELSVRVAGPNGSRLSASQTGQIDANETQLYAAQVPKTAEEAGALEPLERRPRGLSSVAVAAGGGMVLGAGAHYLWNERRTRDE